MVLFRFRATTVLVSFVFLLVASMVSAQDDCTDCHTAGKKAKPVVVGAGSAHAELECAD